MLFLDMNYELGIPPLKGVGGCKTMKTATMFDATCAVQPFHIQSHLIFISFTIKQKRP
jgi:hypothetical protein